MLDIRRLQVLAALENSNTMTSAAAHLHMTPSAVSQQIAALEREVDMALLDRSGRRVRLNAAGRLLIDQYHRIHAVMEETEACLEQLRTEVSGELTISTFPSFCSTILPEALMQLRRAHPQLRTQVLDMEPLESIEGLRSGAVDVAVVDDISPGSLEGVDITELWRDEIVLCLPPDREDLSTQVGLADFADEHWILDSVDASFTDFLRQTCRDAGFEPDVVAHCSNLTAALGLVRAGFGATLISELNLGRETTDVTVRRLDPPISRNHRILTRSSNRNSPAIAATRRQLQVAAGARPGGQPKLTATKNR
ncbi:LysR family transcriptional regulator [Luteococcus sediminum]